MASRRWKQSYSLDYSANNVRAYQRKLCHYLCHDTSVVKLSKMRDSSIRQGELLYTCHAKLREEISNKNPNLRVLVGHANLLEMLVLRFTEMEHGKIADASFILEQLVERVKRKIRSGTDTEPLSDTAESDIKGSDVIKGGNTYQEEIATSEPSSHDVEESPATISTTHEEKDRVDAYEKKWRSTYLVHLENSCAAD